MIPNKVILHHSLTEDSRTVSWGAIRKYHKGLGWSDIGYHFGIEQIGNVYEVLIGRMPDKQGAHTKGRNQNSLGICFVGNFDIASPPPEQMNLGVRLVKWIMKQYSIGIDDIYPHSEFAAKSCPGLAFNVPLFKEALMNP